MDDPWKFIAFPTASVVGYLVSLGVKEPLSTMWIMPSFTTGLIVIAITGFIVGFLVDEVIPTYLQVVLDKRGGGGAEGGFDDDDLDFD